MIIYIEWEDTLSNDGWFTLEEAETWLKNDKGIVKDVGFLVKETKDWVCISPSYSQITGQYDYLKKIPKKNIKKRREL